MAVADIRLTLEASDDDRKAFLEKVIPEPNSGCWIWLGHAYSNGWTKSGKRIPLRPYVQFRGKQYLAHRVAKAIFDGGFDQDAYICHRCDNRMCVNPEHLYVGDHASNMRDMKLRRRHFAHTHPEEMARNSRASGRKTNPARGEDQGHAVLTNQQAYRIRRTRNISARDLANAYGVSINTIRRIWRNETYLEAATHD